MDKELTHAPEIYARYFAILSHHNIRDRRIAGLYVSAAHSEAHLNGVAALIPKIGAVYNFSLKETQLGIFAAQFHDIVRSGREDLGDKDEKESAEKATSILAELDTRGAFPSSIEEREAVSFAIINHEIPPVFFNDPETREDTPQVLSERVHTMLHVADVLQRLGVPLIHRRSAFVGGERRNEGDLKGMQYQGEGIDAIHAIILESAVRLGWKSVEHIYPKRLAEVISPAFSVQREWVTGLLASRNLDISGWADILWSTRNEQDKNIFELSKLPNSPDSKDEIIKILQEVGKITDNDIKNSASNPDLVESSKEAAFYFSSHYNDDPSKAIEAWTPQGEYAIHWKKEM